MMDPEARAAQQLFQAVVARALIDATQPAILCTDPIARKPTEDDVAYAKRVRKLESKRRWALARDERHQRKARDWLLGDSGDFRHVVTLAGYDPDAVRDKSLRLAGEGWTDRLAA